MIPDYQAIMLPLLQSASDNEDHSVEQITRILADTFRLTDEERQELLPSGTQRKFHNRVGWALTYLKKAGLLDTRGRGLFGITAIGRDVLASKPEAINNKFLSQYQPFLDFRARDEMATSPPAAVTSAAPLTSRDERATPEERIDVAVKELNSKLVDDVFDRLQNVTWQFFERLVLQVLLRMGYGSSVSGAAQLLGKTGDQGVDGVINEDSLGLDKIYIQAKAWTKSVGSPEMQSFVGALEAKNARKGVFLTTSKFTRDARDLVRGVRTYSIAMIDGIQLANLMVLHGLGVQTSSTIVLKRLDSDFFESEA